MTFWDLLNPIIRRKSDDYGSANMAVLSAIADSMSKAEQKELKTKLQESLSTVTGSWLDYWGEWFGVPRRDGEDDDTYRKRIMYYFLMPRSTTEGILEGLKYWLNDNTLEIKIYEPWKDIFYWDQLASKWDTEKYYTGNYYRYAVINVTLNKPVSDAILNVIQAYKPAGVEFFFTYNATQDSRNIVNYLANLSCAMRLRDVLIFGNKADSYHFGYDLSTVSKTYSDLLTGNPLVYDTANGNYDKDRLYVGPSSIYLNTNTNLLDGTLSFYSSKWDSTRFTPSEKYEGLTSVQLVSGKNLWYQDNTGTFETNKYILSFFIKDPVKDTLGLSLYNNNKNDASNWVQNVSKDIDASSGWVREDVVFEGSATFNTLEFNFSTNATKEIAGFCMRVYDESLKESAQSVWGPSANDIKNDMYYTTITSDNASYDYSIYSVTSLNDGVSTEIELNSGSYLNFDVDLSLYIRENYPDMVKYFTGDFADVVKKLQGTLYINGSTNTQKQYYINMGKGNYYLDSGNQALLFSSEAFYQKQNSNDVYFKYIIGNDSKLPMKLGLDYLSVAFQIATGENSLGVYIAGVNNHFDNPTYSIKDSLRVFLSATDNGGVGYMALDNPLPPPLYDPLPNPLKRVINQYPYTGSIPLKSRMQIVINNVGGRQVYNGVTLGFDNKVQSVKVIAGNATSPQVRNDGTLWFPQINVPLDIAITFVGFPGETVLLHFEWHNDGTVHLTFGSVSMNINLTSAHS